jgi:hypothetical protein
VESAVLVHLGSSRKLPPLSIRPVTAACQEWVGEPNKVNNPSCRKRRRFRDRLQHSLARDYILELGLSMLATKHWSVNFVCTTSPDGIPAETTT